ncbi:unnamed protein product [Ectocarpus sp. 12 AP-2014]
MRNVFNKETTVVRCSSSGKCPENLHHQSRDFRCFHGFVIPFTPPIVLCLQLLAGWLSVRLFFAWEVAELLVVGRAHDRQPGSKLPRSDSTRIPGWFRGLFGVIASKTAPPVRSPGHVVPCIVRCMFVMMFCCDTFPLSSFSYVRRFNRDSYSGFVTWTAGEIREDGSGFPVDSQGG